MSSVGKRITFVVFQILACAGFFVAHSGIVYAIETNTDGININSEAPNEYTLTMFPYDVLDANGTATVQIEYTPQKTSTTPITLVATWQKGLIEEDVSRTIDVFSYLDGSAKSSIKNATFVVDPLERKITWTIPANSALGSAKHFLTFGLRVRSNLPTQEYIVSHVTLNEIAKSEVHKIDDLGFQIEDTDGFPQVSKTPVPSLTPVPSCEFDCPYEGPFEPFLRSLALDGIQIVEIQSQAAKIHVSSSKEASYTLRYGTEPNKLDQQMSGNSKLFDHRIALSGLQKDAVYYYAVTLISDGEQVTSDTYTLRTSMYDSNLNFTKENVIIMSQGYTLSNPNSTIVSIPNEAPIEFIIDTPEGHFIESMVGKFRRKDVLGLSTIVPLKTPIEEVQFISHTNGDHIATVLPPKGHGDYEFVLEIKEEFGGYHKMDLPYSFYFTDPITTRDAETGEPVENAKVRMMKYTDFTQAYEETGLSKTVSMRSDHNGNVSVVMSAGSYKIVVDAPGYKKHEQEFVLSDTEREYPRIELEKAPYLVGLFTKFQSEAEDAASGLKIKADEFFATTRSYTSLVFMGSIGLFIMGIIFLSYHFHVGVFALLHYVLKHLAPRSNAFTQNMFTIQVRSADVQQSRMLLFHAHLVIKSSKGVVIFDGHTNDIGEVTLQKNILHDRGVYLLHVEKKGYEDFSMRLEADQVQGSELEIMLERNITGGWNVGSIFLSLTKSFTAALAHILMGCMLIFTVLLVAYQGISQSMIMVFLSFGFIALLFLHEVDVLKEQHLTL